MSSSTQEPPSLGPAVEEVLRGRFGLFTGRTIASVVGAALLVLLMVVPSFWAFGGIKASAETRKHTFDVINRGDALLLALRDAETSQRGYLLTGDEAFLAPYLAVRDGIDGQLAELRQRTLFVPAQKHLEAVAPLVTAKLAEMAHAIDLRRNQRTAEALAVVRGGQGKRLMDAIRAEMSAFTEVEKGMLAGIEAQFHLRMGRLFAIIVAVSLLTLLIALSFIYLIHRQTHQRVRDRIHLETRHLLEDQEETNKRLLETNLTLQESEENLAVTLNSIGDAVIATDAEARVTRMNPIAERLTGWSLAEAIGRPVNDCFHAINQETRKPTPVPVKKTLEHGTVQGLAKHTILIARDGSEADIADSCAPIRDRNHQVIGAVLVFRDVTQEYASARALRDSSARIHTILNTAVDGVITFQARDGSVETVNPAAEWMFGYTSEELIGQSIIKLIPELEQGEGDTSLDQFRASDKARAMGLEREVLGHRKDGCFFPLEIVVSEMQLGGERFFTGVLRDITARKEAEEALLKAGALQKAIFDSANFSSIATDAKGVIQIFNVGAERMLGYAATEVMNKVTPADISDASEVIARAKTLSLELGTPITPGFEALVFKASRGIEDIYELTYIRKDGSRFPAVVSVTALRDAENAIIGYLLIGTDNTARKQAEEALLKAGALQSAIFNSANFSSIATDAKGVIQIFNVGAERMLGYAAAEVMNKVTPADISDASEVIARAKTLSLELGSDIAPGFEALVFKASRGIEDIYELTYIRKDGSRFPAVVSVTALRDAENAIIGYLLIGTDNTARKEAEEALLKAGALQSAIFNSANFSSIATDAKGVIQIFNVGAERMLGYEAAEVMNINTPADISDASEVIARAKTLSLELGSDIAPGFEALVFKASRGIEDIYELTYIRKDGSRFPAVVSVTALRDAENAIIGYLLIGTDNSARKQVEAERARLDEALEIKHAEWLNAKVVAEKANLAKSEFLSSMSHELRSPLNAILGFAQLMDSEIPAPTLAQKASLDQILHAGWYLLDLVNEILDLAVIESGKLSLSPESVLLAEVLFDCHAMIEPQAQKRGIKLVFPRADLPVFVQADRVRLKQVLINLLSNAIKYNILGGTVAVTCAPVTPGRTRVSVRDTGHGLAPDMLRQLFQPFNRLGQENSAEDGTGIGLVMSKLLVELMGGTIGVESSVGVGSLFWFELNTASSLVHGDVHFPPKSLEPSTLLGSTRRRTVLYVEDNPANLSLVEQLIARRPDLDLLSAGNATLGIEIARAHLPDVILMDINLPGLNGFQALEILREDPEMLGIPVIAISANAMVGDITKGLAAGFSRYITKPINVVEFMEALDIALESTAANE